MAYLTAEQVRERSHSDDISDPDQFSDEELELYIAEFQQIAEKYCGRYFEVAEITETSEVYGSTLILRYPLVSIDEFDVNGSTFDSYELDSVSMASGVLRLTHRVSGDVSVTYTYGEATPPGIQRACVQYVRAAALRDKSTASRDVISQGFDGGATRYSTPDWAAGRPTGYIEVDRLLNGFGRAIPGIA